MTSSGPFRRVCFFCSFGAGDDLGTIFFSCALPSSLGAVAVKKGKRIYNNVYMYARTSHTRSTLRYYY